MRKIIHIDMDAFYASVEQRDHPEYKGKPVIVGGLPHSRGVVATANYEARKYGIHSAMPSSKAFRLCPMAIFVKPRIQAYVAESKKIHSIFYTYTDLVETAGLDEAYLDVTSNRQGIPSATWIARKIQKEIISKTGLTASAGVSYNKFLAKIASDMDKPNGLTVILPSESQRLLDELPIGKFHGVGKAIEAKMLKLGIETGKDLRKIPAFQLINKFGKTGFYFSNISRGKDDRPVSPLRQRKSVGVERTFAKDLRDYGDILNTLEDLCLTLAQRLVKADVSGKTITLKVRYKNFQTITRSETLVHYLNDEHKIYKVAKELLKTTEIEFRPIRLLGLSFSNLDIWENKRQISQLELPLELGVNPNLKYGLGS